MRCHEQHAKRRGGIIFHVLNRGNARDRIFDDNADYATFEKVLAKTQAVIATGTQHVRHNERFRLQKNCTLS